jgi:serine/threonine-protein kinase RsbT
MNAQTSCVVHDPLDVFEARRCLGRVVRDLGFGRIEGAELAIVVTELAWNILKHGVRGRIDIRAIESSTRRQGVEVVARDEGPGFVDLRSALIDGCDDRGPIDPSRMVARRGLASGLGAVVRFTDSLAVEDDPGGKRIVVTRYRRR